MALNPILASLQFSFENVLVAKENVLEDADAFLNDHSELDPHRVLVKKIISCSHDMLHEKHYSAHDILLGTIRRNGKSVCYRKIRNVHHNYVAGLRREIELMENKPDELYDAPYHRRLMREEKKNKSLLTDLASFVVDDEFEHIFDAASEADEWLERNAANTRTQPV